MRGQFVLVCVRGEGWFRVEDGPAVENLDCVSAAQRVELNAKRAGRRFQRNFQNR